MTLVNAIFTPTGIVMSGDSRTSGKGIVFTDATNKVFLLFERFGVITAGDAFIHALPVEYYIKSFESSYQDNEGKMNVQEVSKSLREYFNGLIDKSDIYFMISGYDEGEPYIYDFLTSNEEQGIKRLNVNSNGELCYNLASFGQVDITNRLMSDQYTPQYLFMHIQDAINYSRHLIKTTIDQMKFEPRYNDVGGEIDTILIQNGGSQFICKKGLTYNL